MHSSDLLPEAAKQKPWHHAGQDSVKLASLQLWPTKVELFQLEGHNLHDAALRRIALAQEDPGTHLQEMKVYDLEEHSSPSVLWLLGNIKDSVNSYLQQHRKYAITARAVVLRHGSHISTHTEMSESDVGVAYWPNGHVGQDMQISAPGDGYSAPTFVLEDPSRGISDLRLPFESRHSVYIRPRPGLLAVFPAHMPHNMHPYLGDQPFVHIVAQVRTDWGKEYLRRY